MGREIRRVPPNWQHPQRDPEHDTYRRGGLQPSHNQCWDEAWAEWLANFDRIRAGNLDDFERKFYPGGLSEWLEGDGSPPVRCYYRPYRDEEATWFQLYETVSEGTPLTPPFATKDELALHLATHGDSWSKQPWGLEKARAFVDAGWAPTMMMAGNKVLDSAEIPLAMRDETSK